MWDVARRGQKVLIVGGGGGEATLPKCWEASAVSFQSASQLPTFKAWASWQRLPCKKIFQDQGWFLFWHQLNGKCVLKSDPNLKWPIHIFTEDIVLFLRCFYRTQVSLVRSMGPVVTPRGFWKLTDVTLVDEDTKSILTDNANRAIQGNQAMHVINSLVCKIISNAISAI